MLKTPNGVYKAFLNDILKNKPPYQMYRKNIVQKSSNVKRSFRCFHFTTTTEDPNATLQLTSLTVIMCWR